MNCHAAPEKIWEYFEDTEKELQWRGPEVVELEKLDSGPAQVGTRFTISLEYQAMNFMGTLMQPVTKLVTGGVLARFADALKQLCEESDSD